MNYQKGNINITVILSFIVVFGIVGLVVYALVKMTGAKQEPVFVPKTTDSQSSTKEENSTPQNPMNPNEQNTEAREAKVGDTLSINYTGRLLNGTVFDSNVDPKFKHVQPFEFKLGAGQVIKGWDEGLVGMKVGEKKTLTIPPEKGYGASGQGSIPPNATLIFDVELLGIK